MFVNKVSMLAAVSLCAAVSFAQQPIRVTVDGQPVDFYGTRPMMSNGRVLVPLRGVFERMGANVDWHANNREIDATKASTQVQLHVGDRVAMVNGRTVTLDVAPRIVGGSTMVPLRFVSEALGANVAWRDADQLVAISTNGVANTDIVQTQTHTSRYALHTNTVIPTTLDNNLSSDRSRAGDPFTATVQTNGSDNYGGLPAGSKVQGHVIMATPRQGDKPGVLQLGFDGIMLPDGGRQGIDGSLVSLDNNSIIRNADGTLQATGKAAQKDPLVYVGVGAGAGALIAMITKGNVLTDTVVGGALGYLYNQIQKGQQTPKDVSLAPGTALGVRLNNDVSIR
jgi:hypothetical protein